MWSNSPELTGTCPVGQLPPASQWFGEVRCVRTTPNSLEPALSARFPLHHSGSGRFGMVEPPQTQSNLPCRPASPFITYSRRFGVVEPPRTQSNLPCRPASPFITVLREGSVCSNRSELTRTCPVGPLPPASGRFSIVEPPRTQLNLPCRPASPLHHSDSRRFGEVEPPRTHSKLPYRPASPCITVVRGGSVCSRWFECTEPSPPISLQGYMVCRVQYALVRGGSVHQMIRDPNYTLLMMSLSTVTLINPARAVIGSSKKSEPIHLGNSVEYSASPSEVIFIL